MPARCDVRPARAILVDPHTGNFKTEPGRELKLALLGDVKAHPQTFPRTPFRGNEACVEGHARPSTHADIALANKPDESFSAHAQ
jgi:hypothetical protein